MMLTSELNAKNIITTIAALTFPVLRYNFGTINWRLGEVRKNDRKTRKVIRMYKMHHGDVDGLYVTRKEGGRGLLQICATCRAEIINIAEYLNTESRENRFVNITENHESNQPNTNSTIKRTTKFTEELNQSNKNSDTKR